MRLILMTLLLAMAPLPGRADELSEAERKAEVNSDSAPAQFNYAVLARKHGKLTAAMKAADRVVELESKNAEAWDLNGTLHLENGDDAGAIKAFEKSVAL